MIVAEVARFRDESTNYTQLKYLVKIFQLRPHRYAKARYGEFHVAASGECILTGLRDENLGQSGK